MDETEIKHILEAALLAAGRPLTLDRLAQLFSAKGGEAPDRATLRQALDALANDYQGRGIEIKEVASGFRVQVKRSMSDWLAPLWEERAPRYTRALLETLALIAYRQPITRAEIEEVRGVVVSTNIIRTLLERGWVRVVGHRDVPGKPAMFGTTREFLDYFGLKRLEDLPPLAELKDGVPEVNPQADLIESLEAAARQLDAATGNEVEEAATEQEQGNVVALRPEAPENVSAAENDDTSASGSSETQAGEGATETSDAEPSVELVTAEAPEGLAAHDEVTESDEDETSVPVEAYEVGDVADAAEPDEGDEPTDAAASDATDEAAEPLESADDEQSADEPELAAAELEAILATELPEAGADAPASIEAAAAGELSEPSADADPGDGETGEDDAGEDSGDSSEVIPLRARGSDDDVE